MGLGTRSEIFKYIFSFLFYILELECVPTYFPVEVITDQCSVHIWEDDTDPCNTAQLCSHHHSSWRLNNAGHWDWTWEIDLGVLLTTLNRNTLIKGTHYLRRKYIDTSIKFIVNNYEHNRGFLIFSTVMFTIIMRVNIQFSRVNSVLCQMYTFVGQHLMEHLNWVCKQ